MVAYKKHIFMNFIRRGMVMKNPWVGQEIWNKVYKGKKLNVQDDAREIRKKEKIEETESEKEDKAIELKKESKKQNQKGR